MRPISELLAPLAGRWVTTITMLHPRQQAGTVYHALDTYRWLPGRKVLVHEVEARMGEAIVALEVFTQDADGAIVSRDYGQDGRVTEYRATVDGGVLAIRGEEAAFTSTSLQADRIEGQWQLKTEQGWVDWMRVALDRVA